MNLAAIARHPAAKKVLAICLASSVTGLAMIQGHEGGLAPDGSGVVYIDPTGTPTACTGHIRTVSHKDVGKRLSADVCQRLLRADLRDAERVVQKHVKVPVTQAQFDALVSFVFNVGPTAFRSSTLLRLLNAGQCAAVADQFGRWTLSKGKRLKGLVTRRADEAALFRTGCS